MMLRRPPCGVDGWLDALCGGDASLSLPQRVRAAQREELARTLELVLARSAFYRAHLAGTPPVREIEDLAALPFTTAEHLRHWKAFLCVSRGDVARMVTLDTSGSTGPPKRLAFSGGDLRRTMDFFCAGMEQLVGPGQRLLVLLPGAQRPHGVADLLRRALGGVEVRAGQPEATPRTLRQDFRQHRPHALVGTPSQLRALLRADVGEDGACMVAGGILSSGEPLPPELARSLQARFGCAVLDHYGLTESGYGGGVECAARQGYHMRDLDVLVEIVDMRTGHPLPAGVTGEVVITTLRREAMPLVRYRTGDAAALLPGPCPCGSPMARLGRIQGRILRRGDAVWVAAVPKGAAQGASQTRFLPDSLAM